MTLSTKEKKKEEIEKSFTFFFIYTNKTWEKKRIEKMLIHARYLCFSADKRIVCETLISCKEKMSKKVYAKDVRVEFETIYFPSFCFLINSSFFFLNIWLVTFFFIHSHLNNIFFSILFFFQIPLFHHKNDSWSVRKYLFDICEKFNMFKWQITNYYINYYFRDKFS